MAGRAVAYWKRSADKKGTLAAANLANRYMSAGFLDEAEQLLTAAGRQDSPHRNVPAAVAELADLREKEADRWQEALTASPPQQSFLADACDAMVLVDAKPEAVHGAWVRESGTSLDLVPSGDLLRSEIAPDGVKTRYTIHLEGEAGLLMIETWETYRSSFGAPLRGILYHDRATRTLRVMLLESPRPVVETWVRPRNAVAGAGIPA